MWTGWLPLFLILLGCGSLAPSSPMRMPSSELTIQKVLKDHNGEPVGNHQTAFQDLTPPSCKIFKGQIFQKSKLTDHQGHNAFFQTLKGQVLAQLTSAQMETAALSQCLTGNLNSPCAQKILANSQESLNRFHYWNHFVNLEKEIFKKGGLGVDPLRLSQQILMGRTTQAPRQGNEAGRPSGFDLDTEIHSSLASLYQQARLKVLKQEWKGKNPCVLNNQGALQVAGTPNCQSYFQGRFQRPFWTLIRGKAHRSLKKVQLLQASEWWLKDHNDRQVNPLKVKEGLDLRLKIIKDQIVALEKNPLPRKEKASLLGATHIIDGMILSRPDESQKKDMCLSYQALANAHARDLRNRSFAMGSLTLLSLPVCILSSGLSCGATLTLAAGVDAQLWRNARRTEKKVYKDFFIDLIDENDLNKALANNRAQTIAAAVGLTGPILGGATGIVRHSHKISKRLKIPGPLGLGHAHSWQQIPDYRRALNGLTTSKTNIQKAIAEIEQLVIQKQRTRDLTSFERQKLSKKWMGPARELKKFLLHSLDDDLNSRALRALITYLRVNTDNYKNLFFQREALNILRDLSSNPNIVGRLSEIADQEMRLALGKPAPLRLVPQSPSSDSFDSTLTIGYRYGETPPGRSMSNPRRSAIPFGPRNRTSGRATPSYSTFESLEAAGFTRMEGKNKVWWTNTQTQQRITIYVDSTEGAPSNLSEFEIKRIQSFIKKGSKGGLEIGKPSP